MNCSGPQACQSRETYNAGCLLPAGSTFTPSPTTASSIASSQAVSIDSLSASITKFDLPFSLPPVKRNESTICSMDWVVLAMLIAHGWVILRHRVIAITTQAF
jgi:hypothetical protein